MSFFAVMLICLQAGLLQMATTQTIPCNNAINLGTSPLTITSATFTPLPNNIASKTGLPGPVISEIVPNVQCGDFSLTGDLPIGGTIKVSGCFPVYGMVAVDGAVPSTGKAVVNTGVNSFPAQLAENVYPKTVKCA